VIRRLVPSRFGVAAAGVPVVLYPLLARPLMAVGLVVASAFGGLAWLSLSYPVALADANSLVGLLGFPIPNGIVGIATFAWIVLGIVALVLRAPRSVQLTAILAPPVVLSLLLFVLMIVKLGATRDYEYGSLKTQLFVTRNLAMLVAGLLLAQRPRDLRLYLLLTLALSTVAALVAVSHVVSGGASTLPERYSLTADQSPIWLGRQTGIGVLLALWLALTGSARERPAALVALPVLVIGLLAAGSRGPLIGLVVGVIVLVGMLLVVGGRVRARLPILLVAGVAAIGVAAQVVPSATFDRAASIFTGGDPTADVSNGRDATWRIAWETFLQHPLGTGTGDFAYISPDLRYPHNIVLEAAVELGVLGAVLLLGTLILGALTLRRAMRVRGEGQQHMVIAIATLGAFALVNAMFSGDVAANAGVWLAIGLAVGAAVHAEQAVGATVTPPPPDAILARRMVPRGSPT
jgi:O-antigen ligase